MLDKVVLIGALVGSLQVTAYRSLPGQTDDTPNYTSTNEHVRPGGVAVSQDLLCGACRRLHHRCKHPEDVRHLHYGDYVLIDRNIYQVNDAMGKFVHYRIHTRGRLAVVFKRQTRAIDIWKGTYAEEKATGIKIKAVYKLKIYDN